MKIPLFFLICLTLVFPAWAQTDVQVGNYDFLKKERATAYGYRLVLDGDEGEIEDLLKERFETATGANVSGERRGVEAAKGAVLPAISDSRFDYYYKVDENDDRIYVTMWVSPGNYNELSPQRYPEVDAAARRWLGEFATYVRNSKLDEQIVAQNEIIEELVESQTDLNDERQDLMEDRDKAREEITEKREEIAKLQEEIGELEAQVIEYENELRETESNLEAKNRELEAARSTKQTYINQRNNR